MDVHLFVRPHPKLGGRAAPFVYCGQLEFLDGLFVFAESLAGHYPSFVLAVGMLAGFGLTEKSNI